jgi:hypothetical protein
MNRRLLQYLLIRFICCIKGLFYATWIPIVCSFGYSLWSTVAHDAFAAALIGAIYFTVIATPIAIFFELILGLPVLLLLTLTRMNHPIIVMVVGSALIYWLIGIHSRHPDIALANLYTWITAPTAFVAAFYSRQLLYVSNVQESW